MSRERVGVTGETRRRQFRISLTRGTSQSQRLVLQSQPFYKALFSIRTPIH